MQSMLAGMAAGSLATTAMTVAFVGLNRLREPLERAADPLPPEQVGAAAAYQMGLSSTLTEREFYTWIWTTHFAYGAAMGGAYAPFAHAARSGSVPAGVAFGLTLWAASYLGWLPALRWLPSATRKSAQFNAMNIGAHLVFGATLAWLTERLDREEREQPARAPARPASHCRRRP